MLNLRQLRRTHPRILFALALGLASYAILPADWRTVTQCLTSWNVTIWTYLALIGWLVWRNDPRQLKSIAAQEDNNAAVILTVMSCAALASLAAIVLELSSIKNVPLDVRPLRYALTIATVFGSWALVGVMFTFHYARLYYVAPAQHKPLRFPEEVSTPNYWDFLYFSFTIAVAAQTSDISVVDSRMRRVVLVQSILSFLFNVAIVGFSINIAAGLIG